MLESQAKSIYLGIGSNKGDKKKNIELTKLKLSENNIKILKTSNYYESLSWPNSNNPKFLNIVLSVKTVLNPYNLIKRCKKIEQELGRTKSPINAPRVCDIDILDFKRKKMMNKIILPHPRMHNRNFVLLPLFELDKKWTHPITGVSIKKLIFLLPNSDIRSIKQI